MSAQLASHDFFASLNTRVFSTGGLLGLFNAIQSIGGLAALPFAAYSSDLLGRRMTIFVGSTIMLIATAV